MGANTVPAYSTGGVVESAEVGAQENERKAAIKVHNPISYTLNPKSYTHNPKP
jgi:hypothetical protein